MGIRTEENELDFCDLVDEPLSPDEELKVRIHARILRRRFLEGRPPSDPFYQAVARLCDRDVIELEAGRNDQLMLMAHWAKKNGMNEEPNEKESYESLVVQCLEDQEETEPQPKPQPQSKKATEQIFSVPVSDVHRIAVSFLKKELNKRANNG